MNRDEQIIALAMEIAAKTRESGLVADDYHAAFSIARELMNAQWHAEWKAVTAFSTLGEKRQQAENNV